MFRGRRADHTLQPTALVHEAYLRMFGGDTPRWNDRNHFLAVAATAMRQILADHARRRASQKRGGDAHRVTLAGVGQGDADPEIERLEDALRRLEELEPRHARLIELRFFGGMTVEEAADMVGISKTTAESDWRLARAWLHRELLA